MATVTPKSMPRNIVAGGLTPWGNLSVLRYVLQTAANGGVVNGDSTAPLAVGDVVNVGVIPAGLRIIDSEVIVKTGLTADVTGKLGYAYIEPAAGDTSDDDYFGTGLVLSTAARLRNATANGSVTLQQDAYLTLTTAGAANAKEGEIEILIFAIAEGVK